MEITERRLAANLMITTTATLSKAGRALAVKIVLNSNERTWEGDTPDIGAVLGLRTEYLNKKTSFRVFMEKMEEYILRKLDNGGDVLPLVREQKDPRVSFEKKHLPKELSTEDKRAKLRLRFTKKESKCT